MSTPQPATDRPRRPWWFRLLKGLFLVAFALVTLVALLVSVENWRGERAWQSYQAELRTEGERLSFAEIVPPMPPAGENFGSLPLLANLLDYPPGAVANTNAEQALRVFDLPRPAAADPNGPPPALDDMAAWANSFRELSQESPTPRRGLPEYPAAPAGATDAQVVLKALSVADAPMAEICTALERPHSQFAVHYQEAFSALLPHLARLKGVQSHLRLRITARLAAGQTNQAAADLRCAFRLSQVLATEPLLISQLVRLAQSSLALASLQAGLEVHAWSDADLAEFQRTIRSWDFLAGAQRAFVGERAGANATLDAMVGQPELAESLLGDPSGTPASSIRRIPRGFIRQNQVALNRHHTAVLQELRSYRPTGDLRALLDRLGRIHDQTLAESGGWSPYRIFIRLLIPATRNAVEKMARAEALAGLGDLACALERHRLAHGSHPATLAELDSRFLAGPARDPLTSQLPAYERLADGTYRLWSVGVDGRDDGGVWKKSRSGPELDLPWPRRGDEFRVF